jgi:hypothetical protein
VSDETLLVALSPFIFLVKLFAMIQKYFLVEQVYFKSKDTFELLSGQVIIFKLEIEVVDFLSGRLIFLKM